MEKNNIRLAMAVNNSGQFQQKHFGDADKYMIYEKNTDGMKFVRSEINKFKNLDEEQEHGSAKKGNAIIDFLKSKGVNVLVSRQFGRNIKMVNRHFIPVIIYTNTPEEVLPILSKQMKWITDEIDNNPSEHKLFIIKNGVMKTSITKSD
ncbi:MAG: hypothetical protein K9H26_18160 [Prolixibacteraceae bacterium]|nr:hypothetical protein [Prolixibacteraceae bacterium]